MNQNSTTTTTQVPLHKLLRRRRQELSLIQAQIAEALHVTPECIGQWESGHRRMELSKIPRIAAALHMDAKELCVKALAEFHPLVYATLFGTRAAPTKIHEPSV
jgi:transcriptional regulator with XRE-family HTH domain